MNIKDDFILKDIHEGYLVGGMVRDFFLGKKSKDRDIAIKGAENFAKNLAKKHEATFIILDSENKVYRVILKDKENYLDISELRGKHIEDDLLQRDFTINSIAYDLKEEKFIDITDGIKDIRAKRIKAISETNFIDDPLRILRAFRFMATLGFKANKELEQILIKNKNLIAKPAGERIQDEIMKLFGGIGNNTSETLLKMLDLGILEQVFPCVKDIKQVPPNSHHHLDLIHHLIETVRQIEIQYENSKGEILDHLNQIDFGGYPRINHLKLAGLLHDIGKPSTWTLEDNNEKCIWKASDKIEYPKDKTYRHRFIKHDIEGERLAKSLLKDLKFSNKQIEYISNMIRYHIYPSNVIVSPNLDNKVMMRYIRKMDNNVIDNIFLAKADRLSAQGPDVTNEMIENNLNGLNKLIQFYLEVKPTLKPLPKLLDGNEIMHILDIKQSPLLGKIINELKEAQSDGIVNTKEDAINLIINMKKNL